MTDRPNVHHEINYIEISATNLAEAKTFYGEAFGWQFNEYGPEYIGIRRQLDDGECGGICYCDNIVGGGPLVILYSIDLESTLASVTNAGGQITKEIFEFPGGRRFQFCDPSGNELAVWSEQSPVQNDG